MFFFATYFTSFSSIKKIIFIYGCACKLSLVVVSGFLIVVASAVEHSLQGMWPLVVAVGSVVADPRL